MNNFKLQLLVASMLGDQFSFGLCEAVTLAVSSFNDITDADIDTDLDFVKECIQLNINDYGAVSE